MKGMRMQRAEHILQALRKLGEERIPLTRVYRSLFSEDLYLAGYAKIYRNAGALTPGTENDTVDGMSLKRIRAIIEALRNERYRFRPSRRIHIPKKSGSGTRPLGIPNFADKLVQEAMRMLLEAYYEPRFRESSHGFRPNRGCHTALQALHQSFGGAVWFIEGDIKGCFDNINHDVLMNILSKDIQDGRLLNLIQMGLKAGIMDGWKYHLTYSGTPQGGVLSPLLSNIYLHELDVFVEDVLIPRHTQGAKRAPDLAYKQMNYRIWKARKQGDRALVEQLEQERRQLPSGDRHDPNFRRLKYVRYADDFILAFIGPRQEAEAIKAEIGMFLRDQLKLELSQHKTLITHAKTQQAQFLGYAVSTYWANDKLSDYPSGIVKRRSINGHVRLGLPVGLVRRLMQTYQRNGKSIHDANLLHYTDANIIYIYQQRFQGLAEYYKFAVDRHHLKNLKTIMQESLVKTLAHKYRLSVSQVYRKYRAALTVGGQRYKVLQVEVPTKEGIRRIHWGGIPLKVVRPGVQPLNDRRYFTFHYRSDLIQRLQMDTCELCGSRKNCEVHHVRKLADLKQRWAGRNEPPPWVTAMIAMQRKTLVVCEDCHNKIHAGQSTPRLRK
jgi:group II intron reverse transcriptase/maturase